MGLGSGIRKKPIPDPGSATLLEGSVADPHHINAVPDPFTNSDPDPTFHFNPNPDLDPFPHQSYENFRPLVYSSLALFLSLLASIVRAHDPPRVHSF
jgi:hypothetical protein